MDTELLRRSIRMCNYPSATARVMYALSMSEVFQKCIGVEHIVREGALLRVLCPGEHHGDWLP